MERAVRDRSRLTRFPAGLWPATLWVALFLVLPFLGIVSLSLQEGSIEEGFRQTLHVGRYPELIARYAGPITRSLGYASLATLACLLLAYPTALWLVRRRPGIRRAILLLIIAPFGVSFVIRTLAWRFLASDEGILLEVLRALRLASDGTRILSTPFAVIAGLAFNLFPFMLLPIYAALDRIDPRLEEAAADLGASPRQRFFTVLLPLSRPGVIAGTLMTFVPAAGDAITASLLGGTGTTMLGNVIQREALTTLDYPDASALAVLLMLAMALGTVLAMRRIGARDLG